MGGFGEGCSGEGFEDLCSVPEGEERDDKIESAGLLDLSAECSDPIISRIFLTFFLLA